MAGCRYTAPDASTSRESIDALDISDLEARMAASTIGYSPGGSRPPCPQRPRPGPCPAVMKAPIRQRLEKMTDRFEEVGRMLAAPDLAGGSPQFRELSVEYAKLQPLADRFRQFRELERERSAAEEMLSDADSQMRTLGEEELARLAP